MPLVTVTIPVHNGEKYLAEAIDSVLAQSFRPIEVFVVDDGSVDRTAEIVKGYGQPVNYVHQEQSGTASARNRGVSLARGDFFAFLDADDVWAEDKLERQLAVFDSQPDVEAVFGHAKQFYSPELMGHSQERTRPRHEILPAHLSSAMLIKRDAFFRVSCFDPHLLVGIDMNWYMRAVDRQLNMVMLPDVLYMRRIHESNKGITNRHLQRVRLRILKSTLDRRREKSEDRVEMEA